MELTEEQIAELFLDWEAPFDPKPYKCPVCRKAFASEAALSQHMKAKREHYRRLGFCI